MKIPFKKQTIPITPKDIPRDKGKQTKDKEKDKVETVGDSNPIGKKTGDSPMNGSNTKKNPFVKDTSTKSEPTVSTPEPPPVIIPSVKIPPPVPEKVIDATLTIDPETSYFFVFGSSNAGKSAMLSGMLYYLKTASAGQLKPLHLEDEAHHKKGKFVLKNMIKSVRRGKFINRTTTLDASGNIVFPAEINLEYTPEDDKKPVMPFCILEMAGEDLEKLELQNDGLTGGQFDPRINAYLKHPHCELNFICVVDVDELEDSEDLIDSFIDYSDQMGHKESPVLICISKWDKVKDEYNDVKTFIKEKLPILYKKSFDPDRDYFFLDYSIGEVFSVDNEDKYNFNSKDPKRLINWMYEVATGYSLEQKMNTSIFENLKNKFKK